MINPNLPMSLNQAPLNPATRNITTSTFAQHASVSAFPHGGTPQQMAAAGFAPMQEPFAEYPHPGSHAGPAVTAVTAVTAPNSSMLYFASMQPAASGGQWYGSSVAAAGAGAGAPTGSQRQGTSGPLFVLPFGPQDSHPGFVSAGHAMADQLLPSAAITRNLPTGAFMCQGLTGAGAEFGGAVAPGSSSMPLVGAGSMLQLPSSPGREMEAGGPPTSPDGVPTPSKTHPLYKTELCRGWLESGACRYGAKCQVGRFV